jgi:hypothetical protein
LKEIDSAVTAFSHVVEMAPSHVGARMSLAMLKLAKFDSGLNTFSVQQLCSIVYKKNKISWVSGQ